MAWLWVFKTPGQEADIKNNTLVMAFPAGSGSSPDCQGGDSSPFYRTIKALKPIGCRAFAFPRSKENLKYALDF